MDAEEEPRGTFSRWSAGGTYISFEFSDWLWGSEGGYKTYECSRNRLGFVHHGLASIEHGADLAVIARSFHGVLADHVNHLLVAFY